MTGAFLVIAYITMAPKPKIIKRAVGGSDPQNYIYDAYHRGEIEISSALSSTSSLLPNLFTLSCPLSSIPTALAS